MFKKLFGSVQSRLLERNSDHPLGSEANLAALIAGIPTGDPARQLFEVDEWLAGMEGVVAELGVAAALRATRALDESSHEGQADLLLRYLTPSRREHLAEAAWAALDSHAMKLFAAYRLLLDTLARETTVDNAICGLCAARALRAWALRKKLLRMRYRAPVEAFWQSAHELMRQVERLILGQKSVVAYVDEPATTPLREYLIGVYFELAPIGNLVPGQLEFLDRFLGTCNGFDFSPQPTTTSTHVIDLAQAQGPRRVATGQAGGGAQFFLAAARVRGTLTQLASQLRQATMPKWLQDLELPADSLRAAVMALALHWAPTPPQRSAERVDQREGLLAVFGFVMARRMVAASQFARTGRSLEYDRGDFEKYYEEHRFGRILTEAEQQVQIKAPEEEPPVVNPLETLRKLELSGDKAQMEQWRQVDISSSGIGVLVPTILTRHRIGGLVAVRYSDGLEWRLGLIRRIGRDAANQPSIGLEALAWPSLCASARPVGTVSSWSGDGGRGELDALIVAADQRQVLLPLDAFIGGLEVELRSDEGVLRVRLVKLLERGPDYDYIEFETIQK